MNGQRPIGVSSGESVAVPPALQKTAQQPHDIVVVGGGAGGLELVTQLGKTLGKRGEAQITLVEKTRTHLWKPLLHAIAAGSMDPSELELNYLAQAHWRHFRYRFGEMIALDRAQKRVHLAATHDEEGREITPARSLRYDTLIMAVGSITNDFGTPGVAQHAIPLETQNRLSASTGGWSTPASAPTPRRDRSGPASCMPPSSAGGRPAPNSQPNCTAQRARSSPSASTASIPRKTSRLS